MLSGLTHLDPFPAVGGKSLEGMFGGFVSCARQG